METQENEVQNVATEVVDGTYVEDAVLTEGTEVEEAKPSLGQSILREAIDFLVIVIIAFVLTGLMRNYVLAGYEIPTGSMLETIQLQDRVFAERVSYAFSDPKPGQIVTFDSLTKPGETLIKRCIAVGGQTVDLIDGYVYVDGVKLDEPYVGDKLSMPLSTYQNKVINYPFTVPEGTIWVMGDNRTNSSDSRYFGPVPVENVTGHAFFTYWPLSRIGVLK